ncbi:MAG TPA: hypothetical protein PKG90_14955 [Chitinophagaceae bacterium]|nr:hypothetical protein [Chitinophagaceae bacterium]
MLRTKQHTSIIYSILFLILLFVVFGCDQPSKHAKIDELKLSATQKYLFKLLDDYKSDYSSQQPELQNEIQNKYLRKLEHFLVDSLGRYIDSLTVTVDTVLQEGMMVTTKFHTRDIEFKYGMVFKDSMDSKTDSLYNFMINLKPKQEVTVNFIHLGSSELNKPDDKSVRTIRIFAYPSPLNFL